MKYTRRYKVEGTVTLYYDPQHPDYRSAVQFYTDNIDKAADLDGLAAYLIAGAMELGSAEGVSVVMLRGEQKNNDPHLFQQSSTVTKKVSVQSVHAYDSEVVIPSGAFVLVYPKVRVYKPLP